ncbi:MAG: hypothetical protein JRK53_18160 [Deltaproteobacteria bacterium]|nr:hypothetical protein [Deltaproteobacteria bacterium]
MKWTPLWFSKREGLTLSQIMFKDPDWFYWAYDEGVFCGKGKIDKEAEEVYWKSRNIKIPQTSSERRIAEYDISPIDGYFADLEILPISRPRHTGSTLTLRLPVIDMQVPYQLKGYDKLGNRRLIRRMKYYLFGSTEKRMTKKRCDDFFSNDDNFKYVNPDMPLHERNKRKYPSLIPPEKRLEATLPRAGRDGGFLKGV